LRLTGCGDAVAFTKKPGLMPGRQPNEFVLKRLSCTKNVQEARKAEDEVNMVRERGRRFDQMLVVPYEATDVRLPGQAAAFQALRQFADLVVKRSGRKIAGRIKWNGFHGTCLLTILHAISQRSRQGESNPLAWGYGSANGEGAKESPAAMGLATLPSHCGLCVCRRRPAASGMIDIRPMRFNFVR